MKHPLIAVAVLAVTVCAIAVRSHKPGSAAGPMGMGHVEDPDALKHWNEERLRDPATGRIPDGIRAKELAFARRLPRRSLAKSLDWTQQGPRNRGGRTRAFRVDITDPNVILAGGVTGGIFRSTDAGANWQKTSSPMDIQNTSCLAQDVRPGHEQTWYFGTGENYGVVSGTSFEALLPGDGIFKSTDGGLSWSRLMSTVSDDPQVFDRKGAFKHVNSIVVDPVRQDSDIVVAAIFDGLVRSNDGGLTWRTVLGLDTTIATTSLYTDVRVSPGGVYYAAIGQSAPYKGVYRSTDGLVWTNIGSGSYPASAQRSVIAIDPQDDGRVWFFAETPGSGVRGHSLLRYRYLGGDGSGPNGSWSVRSANLPNGTCTGFFDFDFGYINSQTSYDMCIAVHPTDSNTVFIGGTSIYRSTNGWTTADSYTWMGGYQCNTVDPKQYVWPNHHPDQHWLEFPLGDASRLYSTNDGGVHVTTDPLADSVQWTDLNDRYFTSQFYTVAIEEGASTSPFIIGGLQDNGTYLAMDEDPSVPWRQVNNDDGAYAALPEGRPFMLMSSQTGRLYKKEVTDDGTVVHYQRIDPDIGNTSYNFINQFVLDPVSNNKVYWCAGTRIYRNNDLAAIPYNDDYYTPISTNWEQISVATGSRAVALDISLDQPDALWYGTTSGRVYRVDSLNGTPVRTLVDSDEWPNSSYVSCVAPNDFNAAEWLVTFSNYGVRSVFHTVDSGATWVSVSGNIEENPDGSGNGPAVFWAMIYPTYGGVGNRYFIGTSTGLYSTAELDGDNTVWEQEGGDLIGNVPINMIVSRGSDGRVVVASHGSGVFTANMPAAPIGISEADGLRTGRAWPNPATDRVNIDYFLPRPGRVEVSVHDLGGRIVLSRSLGDRPGGNARFTWDVQGAQGMRVGPGTYLVRLVVDGVSRVERVVVR